MKITIYELLGLIKYNKAPTKIKYLDRVYKLVKEDYEDEEGSYLLSWLFQDYCVSYVLSAEVEILETTLNTKNMNITGKKIEHIKIDDKGRIQAESTGNYCYSLRQIDKTIIKKINEIINVINRGD